MLIVDVSCYFMNDCGVLMCLRLRVCGARSSASKDKMMEEGERDLVIEQHIEETKAAPPPMSPEQVAILASGEDEKKIPAPDHDVPVLRQPMADASNMTPRTIWKNVMQDLRDRLQTDEDDDQLKGDIPADEADEKSPLTADTKQEATEEGKEAVESPDLTSGELEPEDKLEPRDDLPVSADPPLIA